MSQITPIRDRHAGTIDVVVIGAGHSGLAISYLLTQHGVSHVVIERGEVGNAWRERSWESLRLLTPNWQTRLPGYHYAGDDPDGYMSVPELLGFIQDYAEHAGAPVHTQTTVTSVSRDGDGYRVVTDRGAWRARAVVLATGAFNTPSVPAVAKHVPDHIEQLTAHDYRSPAQLGDGGVLVVGASATGLQFADELLDAGFDVTVATGEHVRLPRHYRGRDIFEWMDRGGVLHERYDEIDDIQRGRGLPSAQLVGDRNKPILDLNSLTDRGAKLAGRLMGINNGIAQFSGSLSNVVALADLKMRRLLKAIDEYIGDDPGAPPAEQFANTRVGDVPLLTLDLVDSRIGTIIWSTGFRPNYDWLDVPVLDRKGRLQHDGGVVASPGLYAMGLPLMRRRKSTFIFGVEDDARDITDHLLAYLGDNHRSYDDGFYTDHSAGRSLRRSA